MTIREHSDRTEKLLGYRGEDIHRWIDRFFDAEGFADFLRHGQRPGFNPYAHRRHRHCREALAEVREEFRGRYEEDIIDAIFERHVRDDYNGYYPYREDFEKGGFREKYHEADSVAPNPDDLADYFRGRHYRKMAVAARRRSIRFLWRFILPVITALILLTGSLFTVIVPVSRENLLKLKKEMIRELTSVAVGALDHYAFRADNDLMSEQEARNEAAEEIRRMRYGTGSREYYWIIDGDANMVMHPYQRELEGRNLIDYRDREDTDGVYLFRRATELALNDGEGYMEYWWQHADEPGAKARKLSYVRHYPRWNWIVGTGVYIDDVQQELDSLTGRLALVMGVIALASVVLLLWVLAGALRVERRRDEAEEGLREARERYRALAEASTEGYMLVAGGAVLFVNPALCRILGRSEENLLTSGPEGIPDESMEEGHPARAALRALKHGEAPSGTWTVSIRRPDGGQTEVLLGVSRIFLPGSNGHVVSVRRPITAAERIGAPDAPGITEQGAPADDIVRSIGEAMSRVAVLDCAGRLGERLTGLLETGAPAALLRRCVADVYDAALSRFASLAAGDSPVAGMAIISLGSNARREMTPFSDQDGAMIFSDPEDPGEIESVRQSCLKIAVEVSSGLEKAGFPTCEGGIMPVNPRWCLSVTEWKNRMRFWSDRPVPQSLLEINIILDRRHAWGDEHLTSELDGLLSDFLTGSPSLMALYAGNSMMFRPPDPGRSGRKPVDIKEALKPVEIQIRLMALQHGIPVVGTLERMNALHSAGILTSFSRTDLSLVFETLWGLRFRKQLEGHRRPVRTDDGLDPRNLSGLERANLLACLETISVFVKRRALEIGRT